ncbi:MAG: hypothetical protein JXR77_03215 [Lentisphaeria bacterium]|nr:hypothetical protein [Lentisphaeria bacterium]
MPPSQVFEAELCREFSHPWQPVRVAGASGDLALTVPEGAGSGEAFRGAADGRAWFELPVPATGTYELWFRVQWHGNCSNSLGVSWDRDGDGAVLTSHSMQAWHWLSAGRRRLAAGTTRLEVTNREDGVWFDQVALLPAGSGKPGGMLPATTPWVPAAPWMPSAALAIGGCDRGGEALPPTDYLLHHERKRALPLLPLPVRVVQPGTETPLDVWVRWNRDPGGPAECSFETDAPLTLTPSDGLRLDPGDGPLVCRRVLLRAHPSMPRGPACLRCRLLTADGFEQVREVLLLRPYRWRVSRSFRLNPRAGLDQGAERDRALLRDLSGESAGIEWREVPADAITPFGLLDMRAAVSRRNYSLAYAATRLETVAGPHLVDIQHDDWIRVWIDGREVFGSERCAPATATRHVVAVSLGAGEHDLVVKSCQVKSYWEFGVVVHPPGDDGRGVVPGPAEAAP